MPVSIRLAILLAVAASLSACSINREVALIPTSRAAMPVIEQDVFGPDSIVQETYRRRLTEQPPLQPAAEVDYYSYQRSVTRY